MLVTSAAAAALAACGGEDAGSGRAEITVTATTTQVADLARNVAGDRAEVVGFLPPNADPHEYEPRPSDVEAVGRSDLVLQSGGDLDEWLGQVLDSAGGERPVVTLIDSVATIDGEGEVDPHWWQDPRNAVAAVEEIRDRLIEVDPEGSAGYEASADAYIEQIEGLDERIADCMGGVPAGERKLVTTHDALGYFAERYDIEVIGAAIPALSTQAQPSAGETAALVDQIEREDVNAVFPESGLDAELERVIAEEAGAAVGGELWADTLGPAGSSGATYLDALASNAATLADGFTAGRVTCDTQP